MDRVAVVTLVTSPAWVAMAELTLPSQREYAQRIRADFIVLDKAIYAQPHYDKWQLFDVLDRYDRILYVDADMIVRPDCPDLFAMIPGELVAGENELQSFPGQAQHLANLAARLGIVGGVACPFYLNAGLIVASRAHKSLFRTPELVVTDLPWPEQSHYNLRLITERVPVCFLPAAFNDRHRQGDYLRRSFILHYSVMSMNQRMEQIRRDLAAWDVLLRRKG